MARGHYCRAAPLWGNTVGMSNLVYEALVLVMFIAVGAMLVSTIKRSRRGEISPARCPKCGDLTSRAYAVCTKCGSSTREQPKARIGEPNAEGSRLGEVRD